MIGGKTGRMENQPYLPEYVPARETGLSRDWLRARARAGELPHLKIGRRRFYDINAVRAALATMVFGGVKATSGVGESKSGNPVNCKGVSRAK